MFLKSNFEMKGGQMAVSKADSKKIQELAKEGKQIKQIRTENFPHLSYLDVYLEVRGSDGRSAIGIKRMITGRINALAESRRGAERAELAEELNELVWSLYTNHKANHKKLAQIRKALEA